MRVLSHLFENNKAWAESVRRQDPGFFARHSNEQNPEYLWIGCSDSRVPAEQIVKLMPGDLFVHRNVANIIAHTDLNCLSVLQFAVDILKVRHIIICGHYGCGGVKAGFFGKRLGLVDNWLRHIQDTRHKYHEMLAGLANDELRCQRLAELNVIEQVVNVCKTSIVIDAWGRGQGLSVHGWIYAMSDGLLQDLKMTITDSDETLPTYRAAIAALK